jgi:SH3 domain protein
MIPVPGKKTLRRVLLLLLLLGMALPALAEQGYITDRLHITLRRGPGNEYKILKSLPSATPVEILERGERYLKVRLEDGEEGYVLTQYVSDEMPYVLVAERLRRERDRLRDRLKALEDKERALQAELTAAGGRLQRSESELRKTTEQFQVLQAGSEHVTEIMSERDRLRQETQDLQAKLTVLKKDNARLLRTDIFRWFLAGAGVLWLGWLLGRRPPKRSRSF